MMFQGGGCRAAGHQDARLGCVRGGGRAAAAAARDAARRRARGGDRLQLRHRAPPRPLPGRALHRPGRVRPHGQHHHPWLAPA